MTQTKCRDAIHDPAYRDGNRYLRAMLFSVLPAICGYSLNAIADNSEEHVQAYGLFEHRAIVYDAHHLPLAVVHEIHQRQLLPGIAELPTK